MNIKPVKLAALILTSTIALASCRVSTSSLGETIFRCPGGAYLSYQVFNYEYRDGNTRYSFMYAEGISNFNEARSFQRDYSATSTIKFEVHPVGDLTNDKQTVHEATFFGEKYYFRRILIDQSGLADLRSVWDLGPASTTEIYKGNELLATCNASGRIVYD